jgi:hypothetical protein
LRHDNCTDAKARLDRLMLTELCAMAKAEGRDPRKVALDRWQLRDLRRTARTLMSRIGVDHNIAEAVKIARTYNKDTFLAKKRDALARLAVEIERIVSPAETAKAA